MKTTIKVEKNKTEKVQKTFTWNEITKSPGIWELAPLQDSDTYFVVTQEDVFYIVQGVARDCDVIGTATPETWRYSEFLPVKGKTITVTFQS